MNSVQLKINGSQKVNQYDRTLIDKHQTCINLIEAIMHLNRMKQLYTEQLENFIHFPVVKSKYLHKIEIMDMCIARLELRYKKALKG